MRASVGERTRGVGPEGSGRGVTRGEAGSSWEKKAQSTCVCRGNALRNVPTCSGKTPAVTGDSAAPLQADEKKASSCVIPGLESVALHFTEAMAKGHHLLASRLIGQEFGD